MQKTNQFRQEYQYYSNLSDAHKMVIERAEQTGDFGLALAVKHLIDDNIRMYRYRGSTIYAPQYGKGS